MRSAAIRLASMLLALGFTFGASAHYDKTKWGMSLPKVTKLYPGGTKAKTDNGQTTYTVLTPVGDTMTAAAVFAFDPKDGLILVTLLFPQPGTHADITTGRYMIPTNEQA